MLCKSLGEMNGAQILAKISTMGLTDAQKLEMIQVYATDAANYKNIESITALSTSQKGAAASTQGLGTAFKGLWAMLKANPLILVATGITAAIFGTVKIVDYFTESVDEAKESLSELETEYNDATQNINDISTKLEDVRKKIDEINSLGGTNIADKKELDSLEAQEASLERQLLIEKERQRIASEEANKKASKILNNTSESNYYDSEDPNSKSQTTMSEELSLGVDAVKNYSDQIEQLERKDTTARKSMALSESQGKENTTTYKKLSQEVKGNAKELVVLYEQRDRAQKNNSDLSTSIEETIGMLDSSSDLYATNESALDQYADSLITTTSETDELANSTENASENISKTSFSSFVDSTSLEDLEKLIGLTRNGMITEDNISSYTLLADAMKDTGLSAEELLEQLENLADSYKSPTDYISELQEIFDLQKTVNDELKDGDIQNSTLVKIGEKYPELQNTIALFRAGVSGSEQDLISTLQGYYDTELANYQEYLISKNQESESFYASTVLANSAFIDDFSKNYGVDLGNVTTYAEAKYKIEKELLDSVSKMWKRYYDVQTNSFSGEFVALELRLDTLDPDSTAYKNALKKYNEIIGPINNYRSAIERLNDIVKNTPPFTPATSPEYSGSDYTKDKKGKESTNSNEQKLEKITKKLEKLKSAASDTTSTFKEMFAAIKDALTLTDKQITLYEKVEKKNRKKADKINLDDNIKKKVRKGDYNLSDYDSDVAKKIKKYKKYYDAASNAKDMVDKLKQSEDEFKRQEIDLIQERSTSKINYFQSLIDKRESTIDENTTTKQYKKDLKYEKTIKGKILDEQNRELNKVKTTFEDLVASGSIEEYSSEWFAFKENMAELEVNAEGTKDEIAALTSKIATVKFKSFDEWLIKLQKLQDRISHIQGLLSGNNYDSDGNMTSTGITNQYLSLQGMANAQREVVKYQNFLAKLKRSDYNTDEAYDEQLKTYTDGLRSAQNDVKSFRDSIINLVEEGINAETEAYREYINVQKEALQAQKDLEDYNKTITEKSSDISLLQKKIASLSEAANEGNRTAIKLKQQLEAELAEKQKDLDETVADHNLGLQQDALDEELQNFENVQNQKLYDLQNNLQTQESYINQSLQNVKNNTASIYSALNDLAKTYGSSISEDLIKPTNDALDVLEQRINNLTKESNNITEKTGSTGSTTSNNDAQVKSLKAQVESLTSQVNDLVKFLKSIGYTVYSGFTNLKGYASGIRVINKKETAWTQENGSEFIVSPSRNAILTKLNPGDSVINDKMVDNLWQWSKLSPPAMLGGLSASAINYDINTSANRSTVQPNISISMIANGLTTDELNANVQKQLKQVPDLVSQRLMTELNRR